MTIGQHESHDDDWLANVERTFTGDDRSDFLDEYDTLQQAQDAMMQHLVQAVCGRGESGEEVQTYIAALLVEAARAYAYTVSNSSDTYEEMLSFAGYTLERSLSDLCDMIQEIDEDSAMIPPPVDTISESLEVLLDNEDSTDEVLDGLKAYYISCMQQPVDRILQLSPANLNDLARQQKAEKRTQRKEFIRDTAKVALGTTAALVATQLFTRKKDR